ncbi:MAG: DUF4249 family protein [Bacteroidales bacterium]|nr:DUF4249 family protein [Bacteroidales bacterium]
MKKRWLILAAILPMLGACVYDYEAELTGDQYTVVIEGDILVGGTTTLRFSRLNPEIMQSEQQGDWSSHLSSYWDPSQDLSSSSFYPGTWDIPIDFTARVEGEDGSVVEGSGVSGICTLDTRNLKPNTRYRLVLYDKRNDETYSSSWQEPMAAPVVDSLSYNRTDEKLDIQITFHSDGSTPYYCLVYDEQWEYHAYTTTYWRYIPQGSPEPAKGYIVFPDPEMGVGDRYGRIFDVMEPYPNYSCWNQSVSGVSSVVTTGAMVSNKMVDYVLKTFLPNDRKTSVAYRPIVSIRMISKESYAYWESLDKASTQTGDLFSPIPSLLRGNVINESKPDAQVIGYVGVSQQVVADRLIKANEIDFYRQPAEIAEWLRKQSIGWGEVRGVKLAQMRGEYNLGNRPWRMEFPDSDINGNDQEPFYVWIPERCMDCREQGGTTNKPSGWPE